MSATKPPPSPMLPEHPRYALVEKIAQGDYATVFRGRDAELNREVAIKQIHAQYLEDPHQLDRYWQEAQLMANLEHARIMTIYDIVRERGWLILELMMGSMQQILNGRPIDMKDLRYLLTAIAYGLQFLERNGIVHGDVKPSNMLVDKNRQVKLGDFGIARRLASGEGSVVKGTAKYMAPEVLSDQFGAVGPHSDLYSLGFSAYELMCGRNFESLFPGLNMFGRDRQVAWMMWQSAPDRRLPEIRRVLQDVPHDLARVVEKLCEKDPAQRYRTADEVLQDLEPDKVRERRPTAQETAEAEQAARQLRRKRLLSIGILAVSVLLSLGLAFWPSSADKPPPAQPNDGPDQGALVQIDRPHHRLALETDAGQVGAVSFDPHQDIVVLNEKTPLNFDQLQIGDQITVKRVLGADGRKVVQRFFRVARPEATEVRGVIASVGTASRMLAITPPGATQSIPDIFVPSSVQVQLNGAVVPLDALRADDRIVARYLSDREGLKAESIVVERVVELAGVIEALRLPVHATVRRPDSSTSELLVDADCQVKLNGRTADAEGHVFTLADLRQGDRVSLRHDSAVRSIEAQRVLTVTGTIERTDVQGKLLVVRQNDQAPRSLSLAENCTIQLADGEPVTFAALRTGDAVTVVEDSHDGRARSIQAVFAPDRQAWAIVMGQSQYDDGRLTSPAGVQPDVELIRQTLRRHGRVVEEQMLWLLDATRFGVQNALAAFLKRIPAEGRLLVYYAGHASRSEQAEPFLALRDFDLNRPQETGLTLASFLESLDAAAPGEKIFLFDVHHGGEEQRFQPAAAELLEALKSRQGTVARSVYVVANCERGQLAGLVEGGANGVFAACTAAAFKGEADQDRDHHVTTQELYRYLKIEVPRRALPASQDPVLFEPVPPARLNPEALAALRELLEMVRLGKRFDDDRFALTYPRAAALTPNQPDAQLIYALAVLKDKLRSKLAQDKFAEIAGRHPNAGLAHHALAWLYFRNQDYDRGLESLRRAVACVEKPKDAYDRRLIEFAGQLCGFADATVADPKLRAALSQVYEAVPLEQLDDGKQARSLFSEKVEELRKEVQRRDQEIQQTADAADRQNLERRKKTLTTYADFDFPSALTHLEAQWERPR